MDIQNVSLFQSFSSLDVYHSNSDKPLPGIVIIPGGSYNKIMERDSERVAITFASHAFQAFVVRYPVVEHKDYQAAKSAVAQAFDHIVAHADELNVDLNRLGIIGFSAGGQLAAAYSNIAHTKAKFVGLGYPVIKPTIDDRMGVSTEDVTQLVNDNTPATFIWGSFNDQVTPFNDHILPYVQSLRSHDVPVELHEFSTGNHGLALANKYTGIVNNDRTDEHMSEWFKLFLNWLKTLD